MKYLKYTGLLMLFLLAGTGSAAAQLSPVPDSLIEKEAIKALYFKDTRLYGSNTFGFSYINHTQNTGSVSFFIEYRHSHNKAIMDDEFTEQWYFMLPADTRKSFGITGADLKMNEVYYCKLCYCMDAGCHPATEDWHISGRRKGKKWHIRISRGDISYTFTAMPEKFENFPK